MRHVQPWVLPLDIRLMSLASWLLAGAAVIGLAAGVVHWFINQSRFDLRVIEVHGALEHNTEATLRLATVSRIRGNFFTVNLEDVRAAFESAPWVRKAMVQRLWPYGLRVTLEEYQPVALWGADRQTSHLLDTYGDVFEANVADVDDQLLPLLSGPDEPGVSAQMWLLYQRLLPQMALLDRRITTLQLSELGTWSLQLDNGATVVMGRGEPDEVEQRLRRFVQTAPVALRAFEGRPFMLADLRYSNDGYALKVADAHIVDRAAGSSVGQRR